MRWAVEECFALAKVECGLDEHVVRSWTGWHRHVTLSLRALAVGGQFYLLFRSVDAYQVEVLLSLALVTGGYAPAERLVCRPSSPS